MAFLEISRNFSSPKCAKYFGQWACWSGGTACAFGCYSIILAQISTRKLDWYFTTSLCCRYNCNRYNEDDAKAARDAQEVSCLERVMRLSVGIRLNVMSFHSVRSARGRPCRGTCSTATATWITCRACASSTSCTLRSSKRWRRCSSTTCPGLRCSSWRRRWTCCASAAPRSCSLTSLPSTSRRTTSQLFLR